MKTFHFKTIIEFLQRNQRRVAYGLTVLCMLLLGLFSGMLIGPRQNAAPAPTLAAETDDAAGVLSVLPSTRVYFRTRFLACGHEVLAVGNESMAGKTRAEAEKAYPDWTLAAFSADEVVFEKELPGYCPAHYVLKLEGGELGLYRADETTYEQKRLMVLDYDAASFDAAERAELENGLAFDALEDVNAYLESAES
ncbi:MAG: hypothetical protein ABFC62_04095 [Clostridiaceae bacterium]|nr:hypothetical protein [Eubacteriales bacterium]